MSAAFFDSNIVVYSIDPAPESEEKAQTSRELLRKRTNVFSTQVLIEIFNTLRRMQIGSAEESRDFIGMLAEETVIAVEAGDVVQGLALSEQFRISHWDGLIIQTAEKAGVDILYSEDLSHGQDYGAVRACNPFIEDFLAKA